MESEKTVTISLGRNIRLTKDSPLRGQFPRAAQVDMDLILDFQATEFVDGAFLGLLILMAKHQQLNGKKLTFRNVQDRLAKIFLFFCISDASASETET